MPRDEKQPPLIEFDHVSKVFGTGDAAVPALNAVSLRIGMGEFVAIMGPSGSGKSTAMNILGCLDTPTSGAYRFMGVDVGHLDRTRRALLRRRYLGFVFQGFNLLARTSAVENVELPLVYRGMPPAERRRLALDALARVGLAGREYHTSSELSGGQQQRVAIARAIVTEPTVLLADEPTGNLDVHTAEHVFNAMMQLVRSSGLATIIATHNMDLAARMDRRVTLQDGRMVEMD